MRIHISGTLSLVWTVLLLTATVAQAGTATPVGASAQPANIVHSYGQLPLTFELNQGQTDPRVKYLSRGPGYSLFLTPNEAVLSLRPSNRDEHSATAVLRMTLLGANPKTEVSGQNESPGRSNYFIGNDPGKWRTDVPRYARVRYANVYPGVDLIYYGNQRELEYDFVLQPDANPEHIRLRIGGASNVRLEHGDLQLTSAAGEVRLRSPHIYQNENGIRHEVHGSYIVTGKNEVGFRLGAYDRRRALVIDPVLAYSTYLGGSGEDRPFAITIDEAGNAYVTGGTSSPEFPILDGVQSTYHGGASDVFVTKIKADGSQLMYSTYLGGSSGENATSIAVDSTGIYITGDTESSDFPTRNPIQPTIHGHDAFVTKINASGNDLVYSTYLGGSDWETGWGIAVDASGKAHVRGDTRSNDFPVVRAIQPHRRARVFNCFVSEFNADGTELLYSTYWGGSAGEGGVGIGVDAEGNTYIGGYTFSTDFPTVNPIQSFLAGEQDAFLSKFSADGQTVIYSTYLGGTGDERGEAFTVDSSGNAYIGGYTSSTDFPMANAIQSTNHGHTDAFVSKINAAGNALVFSTYLGGIGDEGVIGLAADSFGNAFISGYTSSPDFPVEKALEKTNHGARDAFVAKVSTDGHKLLYSTYLGGSADESNWRDLNVAIDTRGTAYVAGTTASLDFPTTPLAFQRSSQGGWEGFVVKIAQQSFLDLSRQNLLFGPEAVAHSGLPQKLVLANNGSDPITINNIYLAGANAGDFVQTSNCSKIGAGGTCGIFITFTPSESGVRKAMLAISGSDPASPHVIALTGSGRATVVRLSPTRVSFENQPVGTASSPKTVIVTNLAKRPLNLTAIGIAGTGAGDFIQTNTCGTRIAAGATCKIKVRFTPTTVGNRKAILTIDDDGGASPQRIPLSGTGT